MDQITPGMRGLALLSVGAYSIPLLLIGWLWLRTPISRTWETAPDATTILSRDDGDLRVERDRLGGRSRAEQQPPLFRLPHGPADPSLAAW